MSTPVPPPPPPRRARRAWPVLLLVLLALPPLLLLGLGQSPRLVARALHVLVPALEFTRVEGAPGGGVAIEAPRLRAAGFEFSAARVQIGVRASWPATLTLEPLRAEGVRLELAGGGAAGGGWPRLPFVLRAPALRLQDATLVTGGRETRIDAFAAAVTFGPRRLEVTRLAVEAQGQSVNGELALAQGAPPALDATLRWRGAASATVEVHGPLSALDVVLDAQAPWPARFTGRLVGDTTPPRVAGRLTLTPPAPDGLQLEAVEAELNGDLDALRVLVTSHVGTATQAPAALTLDAALVRRDSGLAGRYTWRYAGAPTAQGSGDFDLDAQGLRLALDARQPLVASLRGRALFAPDGVQLGATLRWRELALGALRSDGALRLRGTPTALDLRGASRIAGKGLAPADLAYRGTWRAGTLGIDGLDLRVLRGRVHARGALTFAPTPCVTGEVFAQGLDFAALDAALASALEARGHGRWCRGADGVAATFDLVELGGRWRGQPVHGSARYRRDGAAQRIEDLALAVGGNTLELEARLANGLTGRYALAAPDLAALAPGWRGALEGEGTLAGSLRAPRVAARLDGRALGFGAWRAAALEARMDVDFARDRAATLSVTLGELAHGARALGDLGMAASGTRESHRLDVTLRGATPHLALAAEGAWRDARWDGRITRATIGSAQAGDWQLGQAVALSLGRDGVVLEQACLGQGSARACIEVPRWSAIGGEAALELRALPLALLAPWLPATLEPRGALRGEARIARDADGWHGRGSARVPRGALRHRVSGRGVETLPLRDAMLEFTLAGQHLVAHGRAALGDWFVLDARLDAGLEPELPLAGELTIDVPDIAWLERFVPDLAGSRGEARIVSRLAGTRAAPTLATSLVAADARLNLPRFGTVVTGLALDLRGVPGTRVALDGAARVGDGRLAIAGEVVARADGAQVAELTLTGEGLALVRLPDIEADASPDLRLRIAPDEFALAGRVNWPRVQVHMQSLPDKAIATSPDAVLVGAAAAPDGAPPAPRTRWFTDTLSADLDLVLGDDVSLAAAGLEAKLAGAVHWQKPRHDERGRGAGKLSVKSGRYKAYGQSLEIKNGELMFAGAIDNPALNVRAVRPDIDVTAGVRVSGNLRAPKFQLFSEPSMADAEVLSWLVTGHGLTEASSGEAGIIAQAAVSLGAERAALVTSQLSSLFALDELGINPGKTARTSSIVAGKRLTPKLTVRSEFNPFDRLWTFFLNYKLSPRWSVEAQTGAGQGADVIYSVEREHLLGREPKQATP